MADKPRPIIPLDNAASKLRGTLTTQNRPIIPVGVGTKKPSILKGWFAGVLENIPYQSENQHTDDIIDQLSQYISGSLGYDIRRNLTLVAGDSRVDPVTVKSDAFNPVYKRIAGVLSSPGGDRNLRDLSPAESVSDNSALSAYYEMAKRRSANYLSRGQTSEMTDTLFAEKLYEQLEGIESTFGSSGSLRQGFNLVGNTVSTQGKITVSQTDYFDPVNLIFSTGRPKPQALGDRFDITRGGGTYYDRRYKTPSFAYASDKGLPGFQATPGSLRYLTTGFRSDRFSAYHTTRHEIGHHIHEEIKRLHVRARDNKSLVQNSSDSYVSNYLDKASTIAHNLAYGGGSAAHGGIRIS